MWNKFLDEEAPIAHGVDPNTGKAINSNLPPFDIALPSTVKPEDAAEQIVKEGLPKTGYSKFLDGDIVKLTPSSALETVVATKKRNDAIRKFYEEPVHLTSLSVGLPGLNTRLLDIPGYDIASGEPPDPPGGWGRTGEPLDENGIPYKGAKVSLPKMQHEVRTMLRKRPEIARWKSYRQNADGTVDLIYPKSKIPMEYEEVYAEVPSLSTETTKPNFVERGLKALGNLFGIENVDKLSDEAKAQALVMHMAKEENIPLDQYRHAPEFVEKAASSFIAMSSLGLVPAVRKATGGPEDYPATSIGGYSGEALGSLFGLYGSPMFIAKHTVAPFLSRAPEAFANEALVTRLFKSSLRDSILLAPALGLSATGEALEQTTFTQAAGKLWEGFKSGATIGGIFGASRGLFPNEGWQTGARIFTGLVGLNTYRASEVGGNPFTNRPVGEVLFDIALDSVFLYKGLPRTIRAETAKDLGNLTDKVIKVKEDESKLNEIEDEKIRRAQEEVIKTEKEQIELEAKRIAEKAKAATESKIDLEAKGKEVQEIKEVGKGEPLPDQPGVAYEFVSKKGNVYTKTEGVWRDVSGKEVKNPIVIKTAEARKKAKEAAEPVKVEEPEKVTEGKKEKVKKEKKPKVEKKVESVKVEEQKPEPLTKVDEQIGVPRPKELSTDQSPFRDTHKEMTNVRSRSYKDRIQSVLDDPETFTSYLVNEANRWLNGEKVDIEKVRNGLSELSAKSEDLRHKFEREAYFDLWKETVDEAAKWARNADRSKNKRSGGTQLTMGIDPTQIGPFFSKLKDSLKELKFGKMDADQLKKAMKGKQVTDAEIDSVLGELKGTVTKEQVMEAVEANTTKFEDVVLGEPNEGLTVRNTASLPMHQGRFSTRTEAEDFITINRNRLPNDVVISGESSKPPEFSTYQEPGSIPGSYREMFVTAPDIPGYQGSGKAGDYPQPIQWQDGHSAYSDIQNPIVRIRYNDRLIDSNGKMINASPEPIWKDHKFATDKEADKFIKDNLLKEDINYVKTYPGPGEGVLIKVKETPKAPKGVKKILFVEEMQGPAGDTKYFVVDKDILPLDEKYIKSYERRKFDTRKEAEQYAETNGIDPKRIIKQPEGEQGKMPPALQQRIYDIGVKRTLALAKEGGYDGVAWTTGEMQVGRYERELMQNIDKLKWTKTLPSGVKVVNAHKGDKIVLSADVKDGKIVDANVHEAIGKTTDEVFGKPQAEKIAADHNNGLIEGKDLSVGGHGLKSVYNKTLPEKFKKYGKEEIGEIPVSSGKQVMYSQLSPADRAAVDAEGGHQQHDMYFVKEDVKVPYIPITPKTPSHFTLYSGIPVDETLARFRKLFSKSKERKLDLSRLTPEQAATYKGGSEWNEAFEEAWKAKDFDFHRFLDRAKMHTLRAVHERKWELRQQLVKQYGKKGDRVIQAIDIAETADGIADRWHYEMFNEAFADVPTELTRLVDAVDLAKRLKDIYGYKTVMEFQAPKGMNPSQTAAFDALVEIYRNMTPEQVAIARKASDIFSQHVKMWVDRLVEVGIKTKEEGELLKSHNYRKIRTLDVDSLYDVKYKHGVKLGSKMVRSTDSGVDPLGRGPISLVEPDSRILYKETANRIARRVSNQKARLELKNFDERFPDNPFVIFKENDAKRGEVPSGWKEEKVKGKDDKEKTIYRSTTYPWKTMELKKGEYKRSIPKGWTMDYWFDDGKLKTYYMHPDFALQFLATAPHMSFPLQMVLSHFSGVPITRALTVGTSAMWATTRGITMDLAHTFFSARYVDEAGKIKRLYSPLAPKYITQIGSDMGKVFSDVVHRGELTGHYERNGGTMPFLAMREQHFIGRGVKPPGYWAKMMDGLSFWGCSMERWNRVAVMNHVVEMEAKKRGVTVEEAYKDTKLVEDAVHVAVERLPYRQGGWLTKEVDKVFGPFISASYNAARTFARGVKENPVDFAARIANIALPTVGITIAAALYAKEAYRDTPEYLHAGGAVMPFFPDTFNFIDENGEKRYILLRLPLDPNICAVYNTFRGMTNKMLYETGYTDIEPNYDSIVKSITRSLPVEGVPMSSTIKAWVAYNNNVDVWRNSKVVDESFEWPDSGAEGKYDRNVSQLAKDFASLTDASAPRTEAALRQYGFQSNEFTWAMGKLYDMANADIDPRKRRRHWALTMMEVPGLKNLLAVTVPRAYQTQQRVEDKKDESLATMLRNEKLNQLCEDYYWDKYGKESEIDKYIDSFKEPHIVAALEEKRKFVEKVKDLPHRKTWVDMFNASPERKAKDFYNIWKIENTPEERIALDREETALTEAGYINKSNAGRFYEEFDKLVSRSLKK